MTSRWWSRPVTADQAADSRPAPGRARRWAGLGALLIGALLVWQNVAVRRTEAVVTSALTRHLLGVRTVTPSRFGDVVFFSVRPDYWSGIEITAKCTAVVFLTPLAVGTGLLLYVGRFSCARVALAAVLSAALMLTINFARLVMLIAARLYTGVGGFHWAHIELGTWMSLAGAIGGVWVFYKVLTVGSGGRGGSDERGGADELSAVAAA